MCGAALSKCGCVVCSCATGSGPEPWCARPRRRIGVRTRGLGGPRVSRSESYRRSDTISATILLMFGVALCRR